MSKPVNVFQQTRKHLKTGNLTFLSNQITAWQKLTKIIQPLLPQPEQWQVACYTQGVLTITGLNQAMVSQLAYLQKQYLLQLAQLDELKDLQKIQVRLRTLPKATVTRAKITQPLDADTQDMLKHAAEFVKDPKLSQALLRLASTKNK
ncbi:MULTISPECIES: DUF721 domain-containing protein [unclassified Acinetobacter]|uniref:DUF721 domain-containing protein n=1 Tax=unclassified Acinetobacter TaxID=196816 RepID=UPI0029347C19|nr:MULTISPECIES: DUF721 domain-containing protein [unclassified Acinetobacter]WOE30962.1 DUF721 domain-containing protein [Acinetobacter sp. SAAs470]WOE39158.1 DUF721 domain-containing protein [Acinetobacter sp. SAAs474]